MFPECLKNQALMHLYVFLFCVNMQGPPPGRARALPETGWVPGNGALRHGSSAALEPPTSWQSFLSSLVQLSVAHFSDCLVEVLGVTRINGVTGASAGRQLQ